MKYFDAHTHVQFAAFDEDRREVIERALKAGVSFINVGTQADTSAAAVKLANEYAEGMYASVGLHPIHTEKSFHDKQELGKGDAAKAFTSRAEIFDYDYYKKLALDPKTVAIGECGLDYYHLSEESKKRQKEVFIKQMELAKDVKKPLMIHCREAFGDLIEILTANRQLLNSPPGVVHFFSGTVEDTKKLMDLGFSFTFGGVITFPPKVGRHAGDYDEIIKMIPLDRILSETDAPYVAPVPYRGKRNEPAYIVEVVKKLAEIEGILVEEMADKIFENARRTFMIK
ncbi:MAG: TatD family hydrolase [Candidatus Liptonbacteria bacterium]|nr:TatD family hydrolase [Candidatus Liptonbacteria bacterium]